MKYIVRIGASGKSWSRPIWETGVIMYFMFFVYFQIIVALQKWQLFKVVATLAISGT